MRSTVRYLHPDSFTGDTKAFFARLVTLGWAAKLHLRTKRKPLPSPYVCSIAEAETVVPFMYQLTERPLIDLAEDYYSGPGLSLEARWLMSRSSIKAAASDFKLMLFNYDADMNGDFHQLVRWFEDDGIYPCPSPLELQSDFLKSPYWNLNLGWRQCTLETLSHPACQNRIHKVVCHQVAGAWSCYGYVMSPFNDLTGPRKERVLSAEEIKYKRSVYICKDAIRLKATLLACHPWSNTPQNMISQHMTVLENCLPDGVQERYAFYAGVFENYVFWHECGHLQWQEREFNLRQNSMGEMLFDRYYAHRYSELRADAYAFEHCADNVDEISLRTLLGGLMAESESLEECSLFRLVPLRALQVETPSSYVSNVVVQAERLLCKARESIVRRMSRKGDCKGSDGFYSIAESERSEILRPFLEWEEDMSMKVRAEIYAWAKLNFQCDG